MSDPESALPSVRARVIAFASILVGGALGGASGYWFMDSQCTGSCAVPSGLGITVGTVVLSLGTAVVAVISLRALAEWTNERAVLKPRKPAQ